MINLDSIRADESALRKEFEVAGVRFKGRACKCPFHDDKNPSAGIYQKNGAWFFKCQVCEVGGDIFDIRAKFAGTTPEEEIKKESDRTNPTTARPTKTLYAEMEAEKERPHFPNIETIIGRYKNVQGVFKYTNPDTHAVELVAIRWHDGTRKRFIQATPDGAGGWIEKGLEVNPLYNRTRIRAADTVLVVEGEKCVEAAHKLGIVATTSPQGAKSARKADWQPLAGKKCVLWADNDDAGVEYMDDVQRILTTLSPRCSIWRVDYSSFTSGDGEDIADLIGRYGADTKLAADVIRDAMEDAAPVGIFGDYSRELEDVIMGRRMCLPFGNWTRLSSGSQALMPGTVTCIFGAPGCSKSFLIMELIAMIGETFKACVFMLEEDRNYHLRRAHAQLASRSLLTNNEWVAANAPFVRELALCHQKQLDEIGHCIWDAPDEQVDYDFLLAWTEARAKDGYELIAIDPLTAALMKGKIWEADQKFILSFKSIMRRYKTRGILITHPRKSDKPGRGSLDEMAGGAAFQRFAQNVLIIETNDEPQRVRRKDNDLDEMTPNRIIRIAKARNGPGAGLKIAFDFNKDSLRFTELGTVEKSE